jgi:SET domain-containing protein
MKPNSAFWHEIEQLAITNSITIDRPKGSAHPRYPDYIYPLDYGYLENTTAGDGDGIDGVVGGNESRFINHSCRPNCWFEVVDRTIWIRASRLIRAGEELTYDYATVGDRTIPCRCCPGCPNLL